MARIAFENRSRADGQVFRVAVVGAEQRTGRQVEIFGVEFFAQPVVPGARHPGTGRVGHEKVVVIVGVQLVCGADLFQVAEALDPFRLFAGLVQRGQQHSRQNRDDRHDHEQLNEGERP
ncbi:hypothetical protein [uncultured Victivallis sp.]|uniref:hypothetical protein n=1 Tax=uncultured Victivallis sp. TaxID=354118 RepID=UPI002599F989|nr:hypothetical protein [uncultured Victivallis sp.]